MAITASVTPGRVYQSGDAITVSNLNQLGNPTVDIQGTVSGASLDANSVENSHVKALAAIDFSKLATLNNAQMLLGSNAIPGVPTARTVSGDVTIDYLGEVTIADDAVEADMILAGAVTGPKIVMTEEDDARGDILIRGAANYERLAKPETAAGEVLTFPASPGTDPAWVAPTAHALNFEQIVLSGTSYIYNHATSGTDTPVEGSAGAVNAWYLVDDGQGGGGTAMATTSGFTITEGNKVRISMTLHIDVAANHYPVAGKIQRRNGSSGSWGDLYPNSVGDEAGARVQAAFISGAEHYGRGMTNVGFSFIDNPALAADGSAVSPESAQGEPYYRVLYTVSTNRYIHLNRDGYYEHQLNDTISTVEYRLASTLIVEEIAV